MKKVLFTSFALCAGIALTFGQANASEQGPNTATSSQSAVTLTTGQPAVANIGLERFRDFIRPDHDNSENSNS